MQNSITLGNYKDREYEAFLELFNARFIANTEDGKQPLFTTDADGLFDAYLAEFHPAERQHHNCNACKHFINRYAGLVTIDEQGLTTPAVLNANDAPASYRASILRMERIVRKASVTGVFLTPHRVLGYPVTGPWRHMSVELPRHMLHMKLTQTAGQAMAEKREDFNNINRALGEFSMPLIEVALQVLKTDALGQSEKVLGQAQFLWDLHAAKVAAVNHRNVVWKAIATAPAGFCHPRSSMIGTLLVDLASGMSLPEVSRRWTEKMHPLRYQRPQAAPAMGTIAQAEKIIAQMGVKESLRRRFARIDEVVALWQPSFEAKPQPQGDSVFGHLKPKDFVAAAPDVRLPPITMTWTKFQQTVLPTADRIEFYPRLARDNYTTFLTAVNPDAPPILQWDSLEQRNPVSWYVWHGGSTPHQYGLRMGNMVPVSAITFKPSMWFGNFQHQGEAVVFLLEGAKETRKAGAALFPSILKSEFHSIRSVIEAYSAQADIEGIEDCSAVGIMLQKGDGWNYLFDVTSKGKVLHYILDRWD